MDSPLSVRLFVPDPKMDGMFALQESAFQGYVDFSWTRVRASVAGGPTISDPCDPADQADWSNRRGPEVKAFTDLAN